MGIAQALVSNPEVLILDEPTVGLDPKQVAEIRDLIRELRINNALPYVVNVMSTNEDPAMRVQMMQLGGALASLPLPVLIGGSDRRAIEVLLGSERPSLTIRVARTDLDERIVRRTTAMFDAEVIEEVARLESLSVTAAKAIGIAEIQALRRGEITETACREAIRMATRQYAKRQENWFRREPAFHPLPLPRDEAPEVTAARIAQHFSLHEE